jgi:hypothetical protein
MPKKPTQKSTPTPTPTAKPAGKPKAKIDPEIAALRRKHQQEVQAYLLTRGSAGVLKNIIQKQLPRLTAGDKEKLLDHLANGPGEPQMESEPTMTNPEPVNPWPTEE